MFLYFHIFINTYLNRAIKDKNNNKNNKIIKINKKCNKNRH